jgi:hypothetical protein
MARTTLPLRAEAVVEFIDHFKKALGLTLCDCFCLHIRT